MTHRVQLLRRVRGWVRREAEYLDERQPQAALNFLAVVERGCAQLAEHPLSGPPGLIPDTRRLVIGDYILSYRVRRETVEIFAIRHGRQRDAQMPKG